MRIKRRWRFVRRKRHKTRRLIDRQQSTGAAKTTDWTVLGLRRIGRHAVYVGQVGQCVCLDLILATKASGLADRPTSKQ